MTSTTVHAKSPNTFGHPTSSDNVNTFECIQLWQRMSNCYALIEQELRIRFRTQFDSTLPRFIMLSKLRQCPDGLKMNELSKLMNVTNGNVTGLTDQLTKQGLVKRYKLKSDRRSSILKLTEQGVDLTNQMSIAYEQWLQEIFANSPQHKRIHLYESLGVLKSILNTNLAVSIN